jgi:hypothetical protein
MRLALADGTVAVLGFTPKGASKSSVAVEHQKLTDRTAIARAKAFWAERFEALADELR